MKGQLPFFLLSQPLPPETFLFYISVLHTKAIADQRHCWHLQGASRDSDRLAQPRCPQALAVTPDPHPTKGRKDAEAGRCRSQSGVLDTSPRLTFSTSPSQTSLGSGALSDAHRGPGRQHLLPGPQASPGLRPPSDSSLSPEHCQQELDKDPPRVLAQRRWST